jgi:hypothetical protein
VREDAPNPNFPRRAGEGVQAEAAIGSAPIPTFPRRAGEGVVFVQRAALSGVGYSLHPTAYGLNNSLALSEARSTHG